MLTSRAEHRLVLRQDNARYRMLPFAKQLDIACPDFLHETQQFAAQIDTELNKLNTTRSKGHSLADLLTRPDVRYNDLPSHDATIPPEVSEQLEIAIKYAGYIERDLRTIERVAAHEKELIPHWVDYEAIHALSIESRQKLTAVRPQTLGQATRIPGVKPADISILSIVLARGRPEKQPTPA